MSCANGISNTNDPGTTVLFHVQHFIGMGHLVRAFALVEALSRRFRVVLASGGRFPAGMTTPPGIELVVMPALGMDDDRMLVAHDSDRTVQDVLDERRRILVELYHRVRPDVVLVELFPFGRKKLAPELLPLLRLARDGTGRRGGRPLTATSVRDILVTGRHDQQRHDDRAATQANELIDLVLVHGDQGFAALDESFSPSVPLKVPVVYTGFVARTDAPSAADRAPTIPGGTDRVPDGTVVVSAGGGWVGASLMEAAVGAAPILARRHDVATTLIIGPLADRSSRGTLRREAAGKPALHVIDSLPELAPVLRRALCSVSQAGYNTTVDVLRAGCPAVMAPWGDERENEQRRRAERLADHGQVRIIDPTAGPGPLADAVTAAITSPPPPASWSLDGAERTADLLAEAVTHWNRCETDPFHSARFVTGSTTS